MIHLLKIDPGLIQELKSQKKKSEIRKNDRDFQVGDFLGFNETKYTAEQMQAGEPLEYTGAHHVMKITHILSGPCFGLKEEWAILSLSPYVE